MDDADADSGAATNPQQQQLLDAIIRDVRVYGAGDGRHALDPRVVAAMAKVPRAHFVPTGQQASAYDNRPLPIGHGQTISQPLIVAMMTHLLQIEPDARVLEIGTGSGYQAAILAELAGEVVTIEIVEPLAIEAERRLQALGYRNITFRRGDGAIGCPEQAPFDRIIVTAASQTIPPALIEQLRPGGRLVMPVGASNLSQDLVLLEKSAEGEVHQHRLFPVAFVPLTGASRRGTEPA